MKTLGEVTLGRVSVTEELAEVILILLETGSKRVRVPFGCLYGRDYLLYW